jgi:hypothetical protein
VGSNPTPSAMISIVCGNPTNRTKLERRSFWTQFSHRAPLGHRCNRAGPRTHRPPTILLHRGATALLLSPTSLRKWRDRIDDGEVETDWREHLHPSAGPRISSGFSSAAKETGGENLLTAEAPVDPAHDRGSNRRRFTDADKLAGSFGAGESARSSRAFHRAISV